MRLIEDAWPDRTLDITGASNEATAACELVVVATPWDSAIATVRSRYANCPPRQGRGVDGQRPGQTGEGVPGPDPAAGLGGRRRSRPPCPDSLVSASFHHLPASEMEADSPRVAGWKPTCWCAPTIPRPPRPPSHWSTGSRASGAIDAGSLAQAAPIEAFTAVLITFNIRHKVHAAVRADRLRRTLIGRRSDGRPGGRQTSGEAGAALRHGPP